MKCVGVGCWGKKLEILDMRVIGYRHNCKHPTGLNF